MCSTLDSLPGLFCLEQLGYPVPMEPEEFKRLSSKMPRDTPGDDTWPVLTSQQPSYLYSWLLFLGPCIFPISTIGPRNLLFG